MSLVVAILGLGFLILIHEAGHFFMALSVRMRPRKFYIFFPPALVKTTRGGIEYGIGSIPLGGYVKIPGMHRPAPSDIDAHLGRAVDEAPSLERELAPARTALAEGRLDDAGRALGSARHAVERAHLSEPARRSAERGLTDVEDGLSRDAYWRAAAWRRIVVIAAGPFTNLVACVVLLAVVAMLGIPSGRTTTVGDVVADRPAAAMGLAAGDRIVGVDGRSVASFDEVREAIQESRGDPVALAVERDGARLELQPVRPERVDDRWLLGFVAVPRYETLSLPAALDYAVSETWRYTAETGKAIGRLVTGEGRDDVSGPVGIVQGSSEAIEQGGYRFYLQILALISLSLALLNMLPLLPLDGGHILFTVLEKIRGRALPREAYERASMVGIALVLVLFVIGLSNDVGRLGGG